MKWFRIVFGTLICLQCIGLFSGVIENIRLYPHDPDRALVKIIIMAVLGVLFLLGGGFLIKSGIRRDPMLMSPEEIEELDIPEAITKKIKAGWIAAVISGTLTLVLLLVSLKFKVLNNIIDLKAGVDVVLIYALAYGIYKKSRFASTAMFIYFLSAKIYMTVETGSPAGLILGLIFLYFYFQAMIATYRYYDLILSHSQARAMMPAEETPVEA